MAGTHATIGNDIGQFARLFEVFRLIQSGGAGISIDGLDQLRSEIEANWDVDDAHRKVMPQMLAIVDGVRAQMDGAIGAVRVAFDIYARDILRPDIGSTAIATDDILRDLNENMIDDSENVLENVLTTTQPVADNDNVGDGEVLIYDEEPIEKRDNDRIQTQNLLVQVIADSRQNNRTAGNEQLNLQGDVQGNGPNFQVPGVEGSQRGQNRLVNGDMEDATATFPTGWNQTTLVAVSQETTIVYRGSGALVAVSSGAATILDIDQDETTTGGKFSGIAARALTPLGVYLLTVRSRHGGAFSGNVRLGFDGTGYTAAATEEINLTSANLTAVFQFFNAFIVLPKSIPSDMRLQVLWDGTPTNTHTLYLDDVLLQELPVWATAALRVGAAPGAVPFVAGPTRADFWKADTAREVPGTSLFQDLVTLVTNRNLSLPDRKPDINVQLPHGVAASANYAETKAQ